MEKIPSHVWMLSLQEMCLRRITVILCSQTYNLASIIDGLNFSDVKGEIKKLGLPALLSEQMTDFVSRINFEIIDWKNFHEDFLFAVNMDIRILKQLCWTNLGTVDYRKSAEKLVLSVCYSSIFDIHQCYQLCCFYCLDDYISVFWEKLPEASKIFYYKAECHDERRLLQSYWPHILQDDETKLKNMIEGPMRNEISFNQYVFEYSAYEGNKAATEYFWEKLTDAEKEVSLFRTVQAVIRRQRDNDTGESERVMNWNCPYLFRRSDTFCYLLPQLSPEQQVEILKEYPITVLENFLRWPWLHISMDMAELICPYFTEEQYTEALVNISLNLRYSSIFTKLFQTLFLHGSNEFRKHFVDHECRLGICFRSLFKVQYSETIKIIFRAVDPEDRKRLVCSKHVLKHFYKSILTGKCDMVEMCVQEAALAKEDKDTLKELFLIILENIEDDRISFSHIQQIVSKAFSKALPNDAFIEEEVLSESPSCKTETEIEARSIDRTEYVWEQFLHIVDNGTSKTPCTRNLEKEDMKYL